MDGADVRVVQRSGGLGLALEALADFFIRDKMRCEKLQRNGAV